MRKNKTINWTSNRHWLSALCWFLIVVWIRLLLERSYFGNYKKKRSFQWGFSPDVIFMVHYQSEISDALHLPLFILCCYFFLFSWSTQQVKTDSYKLNPSKSPLCVCYHKVFTFEQSAGEGKRSKIAWWILRTKMIRNKLHRW